MNTFNNIAWELITSTSDIKDETMFNLLSKISKVSPETKDVKFYILKSDHKQITIKFGHYIMNLDQFVKKLELKYDNLREEKDRFGVNIQFRNKTFNIYIMKELADNKQSYVDDEDYSRRELDKKIRSPRITLNNTQDKKSLNQNYESVVLYNKFNDAKKNLKDEERIWSISRRSDNPNYASCRSYLACKIRKVHKIILRNIKNNKAHLNTFWEHFLEESPVNLALDLDFKDHKEREDQLEIIDEVKNEIIGIAKEKLEIPKDQIKFIEHKSDEIKDRSSYHLIVRFDNHIFKNILHAKSFFKLIGLRYECLDYRIYRTNGGLRTLLSQKYNKENTLRKNDDLKIKDKEYFKLSCVTYRTKEQENVINLIEEHKQQNIIKSKKIKNKELGNIDNDLNKTIEELYETVTGKEFTFEKAFEKSGYYIFLNNSKRCCVSDETHKENKQRVVIFSNYKHSIKIKFGCYACDQNMTLMLKRSSGVLDLYQDNKKNNRKLKKLEKLEDINISKLVSKIYNLLYFKKNFKNIIGSDENQAFNKMSFKYPNRVLLNDNKNYIWDEYNIEYEKYKKLHFDDIDLNKYDTFILKGHQGRGKTFTTSKAIKEYLGNNDFCLCINPKRSLNMTIYNCLKNSDFKYYQDVSKNRLFNQKRLIITPDSLPHLEKDGIIKYPKILWLDEFRSLMAYLNGSVLNGRRNHIFKLLQDFIKHAEKVIITDADIDNDALKFISLLRDTKKKKTIFVNNTFDRKDNNETYNIFVYGYQNQYKKILFNRIDNNKNVYLTSDCKTLIDLYYKELSEKYPDKKIIKYTSDTENHMDLKDVNENFEKYNIVLSSPTISYGVDFNKTHFDCVFGLFGGRSVLAREANQQLGRVRDIKDKEIHLYFNSVPVYNTVVNLNEIYKQSLKNYSGLPKNEQDHKKIELNLMTKGTRDNEGNSIYDNTDPFSELILRHKREKNESDQYFEEIVLFYLYNAGYNIYYQEPDFFKTIENKTEDELIKEKQKGVKKEFKDEKFKNIVFSPIITDKQYNSLKKNGLKKALEIHSELRKYSSEKLKGSLTKYILSNYYGCEIPFIKSKEKLEDKLEEYEVDMLKNLIFDNGIHKIQHLEDYFKKDCLLNDNKEHKIINSDKIAKTQNIKDLLKLLGFSGLFDIRKKIEYIGTEVIENKKELKELLKNISYNFHGSGRLRGKKMSKTNLFNLLDRLINNYYGFCIKTVKKQLWKNKRNIRKSTSEIEISPIIEFVINKFNRNIYDQEKVNELAENLDDQKMIYKNLHEIKGKYKDIIVENMEENKSNNYDQCKLEYEDSDYDSEDEDQNDEYEKYKKFRKPYLN